MPEAMGMFHVYIVDSTRAPVSGAQLNVASSDGGNVSGTDKTGLFMVSDLPIGSTVRLTATRDTLETDPLLIMVRGGIQQVVLGLPDSGQLSYRRGDSQLCFTPDRERYLLFAQGKSAVPEVRRVLDEQDLEAEELRPTQLLDDPAWVHEGAYLVKARPEEADQLAKTLRTRDLDVQLARSIRHRDDEFPYGLTREVVIAFRGDIQREEIDNIVAQQGLQVAREVRHAGNAFLLIRSEIPDYDVLDTLRALGDDPRVLWAEADLITFLEADAYTPNDPLFPQVSHLRLIKADAAWERLENRLGASLRGGSPAVCIGIVDLAGVALDHPDLTAPLSDGTSKLLTSWDFVTDTLQSVANLGAPQVAPDHGTQCAGSATAAFDNCRGLPGVAPNCRLIAAKCPSTTPERRIADLYLWMAGFDNGGPLPEGRLPAQPADVISSSFGRGGSVLSNIMRELFDRLTSFGRGGRGVVLCWSIGNVGYVDFTNPTVPGGTSPTHRAFPTYERCIGVGSSTSDIAPRFINDDTADPDPDGDRSGFWVETDRRALYSPYGSVAFRKPDLVSPSHTATLTTGGFIDPVMSTVRRGQGTRDGCGRTPRCAGSIPCLDYAPTFGGTSHSTPTVAGAIALMLSARPDLSWIQVRDILRISCEQIHADPADPYPPNATGAWQTINGLQFSRWYGHGRLDVEEAVQLALDHMRPLADVYARENLSDRGDVPSPGWHAESPDIWVRRANEAIPAIAWTDTPPHQNPVRGRDNYLFCRVRNRGNATASTVYVRASFTQFAGFEFRYPNDFVPARPVGSMETPDLGATGTHLIGEVRIDDLRPGSHEIVKMRWEASLIPPAQIRLGKMLVRSHPCLLLEASPHDGPRPAPGVIAVRADNNIAQRNIYIGDTETEAESWVAIMAGTLDDVGIRSLLVDASNVEGKPSIVLHFEDAESMALLHRGAMQVFAPQPREMAMVPYSLPEPIVLVEQTRLLIGGTRQYPRMEFLAAPGSELRWSASDRGEPAEGSWTVRSEQVNNIDAVTVEGLQGVLEIPLPIKGGHLLPLAVRLLGQWKGDLRLTQRRGEGVASPGYTLRR